MSGAYVSVALRSEDEESCRVADFAGWFCGERQPVRFFEADTPAHDEIEQALVQTGARPCGVVFGHGNASGVSARRNGWLWCDRGQFAGLFKGARVYVFACETLAGADAFGAAVVASGVSVFVGHAGEIHAPHPDWSDREWRLYCAALTETLRAFIDGCDDQAALRLCGREQWDVLDIGLVIDAAALDPDLGDLSGTAALWLWEFMNTLVVIARRAL